jgi:hypothetical protein
MDGNSIGKVGVTVAQLPRGDYIRAGRETPGSSIPLWGHEIELLDEILIVDRRR